jgi:hypothetical protein
MKIYRIAELEDKSIKWTCPNTGIYIVAHFIGNDTHGFEVYCPDDSFVDIFDNFWHARNWAKKHMDKDCRIPIQGKRIDKFSDQDFEIASELDQKSYEERYDRWSKTVKTYRTAEIRGEWWIIDGTAHFADGDVGGFNHEDYAIKYAQDILMDGEGEWESWVNIKAQSTYEEMKSENEFEEGYDEQKYWELGQLAQNDPEAFLLEHMDEAGIDEDTFFVANGNSRDAREWSMKKLGWKRMAGHEITTWTLTSKDFDSIKYGIWDALPEEGLDEEGLDEETFNIEVMANETMYWGVPYHVIDSGQLQELRGYSSKSEWGVVAKNQKMIIQRIA